MSAALHLLQEFTGNLTVVVDEWALEKPLPPRHYGMTACKTCGKLIAAEYSHCDRCDDSGNYRFGLPGLNEQRVDKSVPRQALPISMLTLDITLAEMFDIIDGSRHEIYVRDDQRQASLLTTRSGAQCSYNHAKLRARKSGEWVHIICTIKAITKGGNEEVHHNTPDDNRKFHTIHMGSRLEVNV